jgi:AbiU2
MNEAHSRAETILADICRGLAGDVYLAEVARRLLEELDLFGEAINRTGTGKHFFANLQMILQHELVLSVCRLYEPYVSRNPGRSIPTAAHHIDAHVTSLRITGRERLGKFLGCSATILQPSNLAADEELSKRFVQHLADLPKANLDSSRPLDQALTLLKTVRDKAVAHHERIDSSLLRVPGWARLAELIDIAREVTEILADSYSEGGYYLKDDANRAARSLVGLLERAGLSVPGEPRSV